MNGDYLLDTNVITAWWLQQPPVLERLIRPGVRLFLCHFVVGEMWAGTERMPASRRKGELQQFYQELLDRVPLLAVDLEATRAYAKIRSHLMQIGRPVPENDIWIAAIAIRYDIALVTRDQHFDLIPDLRLERW